MEQRPQSTSCEPYGTVKDATLDGAPNDADTVKGLDMPELVAVVNLKRFTASA